MTNNYLDCHLALTYHFAKLIVELAFVFLASYELQIQPHQPLQRSLLKCRRTTSHHLVINEQNLKSTAAAEASKSTYDLKLLRLSEKAEKQAAYFEQQNKYLNAGKRIFELIKKYEKQETNKALNESVKRYVAQEKSKIIALKKAQKEAAKKRKIKEQVKVKSALLMDEELKAPNLPKVKKSEKTKIEAARKKEVKKDFKVGDRAILKSTGQKGNIKEISGNKVSVLVGNFVITTKLSEIE